LPQRTHQRRRAFCSLYPREKLARIYAHYGVWSLCDGGLGRRDHLHCAAGLGSSSVASIERPAASAPWKLVDRGNVCSTSPSRSRVDCRTYSRVPGSTRLANARGHAVQPLQVAVALSHWLPAPRLLIPRAPTEWNLPSLRLVGKTTVLQHVSDDALRRFK